MHDYKCMTTTPDTLNCHRTRLFANKPQAQTYCSTAADDDLHGIMQPRSLMMILCYTG